MNTYRLTFEHDSILTNFTGTLKEARAFYLGKTFDDYADFGKVVAVDRFI